jgi:hypothetical protein
MGGKRPDQHNIDPSGAGATDYKWRHEGRSQGEQLANEEKQHLQSNPHDQPMIPESGVNPAARELRERKAQHRESGAEGGMSAGQGGMTADERVDEASQESFPASDPPQQP